MWGEQCNSARTGWPSGEPQCCDFSYSLYRAPFGCTSDSARWHTGGGGTLGSQRDSEDHADARSEDERRSEFRSGNNARRSLANPDDRARRHPTRVDIDEQAERRGRPGANPRETRKVPRRLQQNREVFGYNADRLLHILVLLTRHQSIEGKGEDFSCICSENNATDSRDRSPRYQLANFLFLPSRSSFQRASRNATWKKTSTDTIPKNARIFSFPSSGSIYLSDPGSIRSSGNACSGKMSMTP